MEDHEVARFVAEAAGIRLLQARAQLAGADPARLRVAGDEEAQVLIDGLLRTHRPCDAVLSEEATDDPDRLTADRVWIVDPLDGTREFAEPPRDDWAVNVALWEKGRLAGGRRGRPARP